MQLGFLCSESIRSPTSAVPKLGSPLLRRELPGAELSGDGGEATHRMSKGLNFAANYTWAHNLSDAQGDAPTGFGGETAYGLAVLNRFAIGQDRGNAKWDRQVV
jgi:hypothetical protein